jgi:hypothetical protein
MVSFSATDKEAPAEIPSDMEESAEITIDAAGNPKLPMVLVTDLKARQDLCRDVFTKAYGKYIYCIPL